MVVEFINKSFLIELLLKSDARCLKEILYFPLKFLYFPLMCMKSLRISESAIFELSTRSFLFLQY